MVPMSIWLDVTTTLKWTQPAVGITRVEFECARHFLGQSQAHVRFCRFDRVSGRYAEVDRARVAALLERPASGWKETASGAKASEGLALWRTTRRIVKKLVKRLRRSLRPTRLQPPIALNFIFRAGDVYCSMGLDWQDKDLEALYRLKQQFGFKVVLFCYDIIPVKFPHLCVVDVATIFPKYLVDVARCADKVFCISKCSMHDLEDFLRNAGVPIPALGVIRLGSEVAAGSNKPPSKIVGEVLRHRFVLFVSTIEARKNHETLYRAYRRLIDAGQTDLPLLVFVGMLGWGVNDLISEIKQDLRVEPYMRILNHVSDDDLVHLYEGAEFTLFPSLYEGWGLGVAESLSHGKFCLASTAPALTEVGGDLIEHLEPLDVPRWAERLNWHFHHPEAVALMEARIRREYRPSSWAQTGETILAEAARLADLAPASGSQQPA